MAATGGSGRREGSGGTHKTRTEERLVIWGFVILLVVGGIFTFLLLGRDAAAIATAVLVIAFGLLLTLYKLLDVLEKWTKRQ